MTPPPRTIAVITGTRADFGLLTPVMRAIDRHPKLHLLPIVAGLHLTTGTWQDVRQQGFHTHHRVRLQKPTHATRADDVEAVARGISGFNRCFEKTQPDVVVVLGDRIEAFAAATAAHLGGYHLAHLHGGDRAEGVADEAMRHAISKLAHLHFPATAQSTRRLKRLGESSDWVYQVGSPAADGLVDISPATDGPKTIVLHHPIGENQRANAQAINAILRATQNHQRQLMAPNRDAGWMTIQQSLVKTKEPIINHLPRDQWLSQLAGADLIIGNSSAGLIEAAILKTPCVNVGPRQAGREQPANVISCAPTITAVRQAIQQTRQRPLGKMRHPYGNGTTGQQVADHLATIALQTCPLRKQNSY